MDYSVEEYGKKIEELPTRDIFAQLRKESGLREDIAMFRCVTAGEAEIVKRRTDYIKTAEEQKKGRKAWMRCSACGTSMLVGWKKKETEIVCKSYYARNRNDAGISITDEITGREETVRDRGFLLCPVCHREVKLVHEPETKSYTTQAEIGSIIRIGREVGVIRWIAERRITIDETINSVDPVEVWIVGEKKTIKITKYEKGLYGYHEAKEWHQMSKADDTLGYTFFSHSVPSMNGTVLENAKLKTITKEMEKMKAIGNKLFDPVAYIRLYKKHKNVENLITSGWTVPLMEEMKKECGGCWGSNRVQSPRLDWIEWKEVRPEKMLGLNREEMRKAQQAGWTMKNVKAYKKEKEHGMTIGEYIEIVTAGLEYDVDKLRKMPGGLMKNVRYLKRKDCDYRTYADYLDAATRLGMDIENTVVRWPKDPRKAHDEAIKQIEFAEEEKEKKAFSEMTERCRGLNWEENGITIRVAESQKELIEEGKALQHCVGGYAKTHASGRIILFIREKKTPEKSWYTLNVDTETKRIIQNHGYRNERLPDGRIAEIDPKVKKFVEDWKEKVLEPWKMPKEGKKNGNDAKQKSAG